MAYQPLTLAKFKTLLGAGQYQSATGARRAIGKASGFTAEDKSSAGKMIDKAFPDALAAAPAAKTVKTAAKAPKAKPEKAKPAAKKGGRPKKSVEQDDVKLSAPRDPDFSLEKLAAPLIAQPRDAVELVIGERIIQSATSALNTCSSYGESGNTVGAAAMSLLGRGIHVLAEFVEREISARAPVKAARGSAKKAEAPETTKVDASLNGIGNNGSKVFDEALPS